jgi:hypothetical protein
MPWGAHQGKRLGDIPDAFWIWFLHQTWCKDWKDLWDYIKPRVKELKAAAEKPSDDPEAPMESWDDYMRNR